MKYKWAFLHPWRAVIHRPFITGKVILGSSLILLALLVGGARVRGAVKPSQNPPGPLDKTAWHTIYLPSVVRQASPTPSLYQLAIDPADLAWLYEHWWTYDTVPAVFTHQNIEYDVEVRFRGGTARTMPKKSWKIDFPGSDPFQGQRELNLNAEYVDKSLLREALAYDLFRRAGLPASRTRFVRLEINGEYQGLFLQVEQVDKRFLDRISFERETSKNWDPNGNLYKGNYGNFELSNDYQAYENSYLKKTNREDSHDDIIAFVEMINYTPPEDFPAALASVMDVGQYLDWVAIHILLGDFEWLEKNYYVHHQLKEGWWAFLPWDLDLLLGHNWSWEHDTLDPDISWDNPIDSGTVWSKKPDGKWNKLITEVLRDEDLRFAYCRRLVELMNDEFSEPVMFRRIDAFYHPIVPYAEADPYKWGSNADFHAGPAELKTYVTRRLDWLANQIPGYCPAGGPVPLINELMVDNQATLADEAGDYEPWIELYNPGLVNFDASGMALVASPTLTTSVRWTLPEGTVISPSGFLLIWADGEPGEGPLHADFRLDPDGGTIALLDKEIFDSQVLDEQIYDSLTPDRSWGRRSDGGPNWTVFETPTPGWSNRGRAPRITALEHTPAEPGAGQRVTVTTWVTDETGVQRQPLTVTLHWSGGGSSQSFGMTDDGGKRYSATLPGLAAGTIVTYFVRAEDAVGLASTHPPRAPAAAHGYVVGFQRPPLYLNELVAINQDTLDDEAGESDDWFEIYNAGSTAIDLGGMYLTDALENSTKWQIPAGVTVPADSHVVLWADNQPEQGARHVGFKLDGDGERLALYAGPDGYNGLIDELYYGPQTVDRPWGRYPDGDATWRSLTPTPGGTNRQPPPVVSRLEHKPVVPLAGQGVSVTAFIRDEGAVVSATLYYSAGLGFKAVPLRPVAPNGYSASIPPQAGGVQVAYYVQARDDLGGMTTYPNGAPAVTYGYQVGHAPPPLFINEFLASNDAVNQDETGAYEDWVELYNAGDAPLDVGGMYLTDDLSQPTKWRLPDGTTIPARGFLLIWTDDDEQDGPLHAGFKLSKAGEEIGLFDRDGAANARIDSVVFGPQTTDVSTGRSPDGAEEWMTFGIPSPGESNN